jgi:hypothetical protein
MKKYSSSFLLLLCLLTSQLFASVGGGYTACGLSGEYFPNITLSEPAAFVRQDNRLDFDFSHKQPVGGAYTPGFKNFPIQGFSVRWSGNIISRFSEPYVFTARAADGIRIWVDNKPILDQWSSKGKAIQSAKVNLLAGKTNAIRIEYWQNSDKGVLSLGWSSPSTPPEIIDPLSKSGFNLTNCQNMLFADDVKYAMYEDQEDVPHIWYEPHVDGKNDIPLPMSDLDTLLYPKRDAHIRIDSHFMNATYRIQFSGKADVTCWLRWFGRGQLAQFEVNGEIFEGTLPSGVGYDAKTNTTTALMTPPSFNLATYSVGFSNSQRNASAAVNSGIADLHIMRPVSQSPGAQPCAVGTVVYPGLKPALQNYTVYRYFGNAFTDERTWSERTLPGMPAFAGSPPVRRDWKGKASFEHLIMLANEMGKDLYLSITCRADHDYYKQLANLIKYGSNGITPYTAYGQWPNSGPVYPPLNSNLRFYIEYSNEVWNWGFLMNGYIYKDSQDAVTNKTPDGQIINYDGKGFGDWKRWQALQTVHISNAFRSVFGDAAMGDRIRVLLFDQYGFYGNALGQFLDNYFNKIDPASTFKGAPHPVSYYIWGGGGAIYYGSTHSDAIDKDLTFSNRSFEEPALAEGVAQINPIGSDWTFSGNAGIFSNISRRNALLPQTLGLDMTPKAGSQEWMGYKFTVGDKPIYVYNIGRVVAKGNNKEHRVGIFNAKGGSLLNNKISTFRINEGETVWARVIEPGWTRDLQLPLRLEANTSYYALSLENSSDNCYTQTSVQSSPGITVNGAATATVNNNTAVFTEGTSGAAALAPVNFTFTDSPLDDMGFICDVPDGKQGAFIESTGSISQTVNFKKTGIFSIGFNAAGKPEAFNAVEIFVDGVKYTPHIGTNPSWKVSNSPWTPGGFERRADDLAIRWGSAAFDITASGNHEIVIQGTGKPGEYIFFDSMDLLSAEAIYGPEADNFPSMGEANGQDNTGGKNNFINTLRVELNWAAAWGLKTMAYEGGWSVGGDFDQKPIHGYCKFKSESTILADTKAIDVYSIVGGDLFCYYYGQWEEEDTDKACEVPLVKSVILRNDRLPTEPGYGDMVPAYLSSHTSSLASSANADKGGDLTAQGAWLCWNIISPITQEYRLTSTVSGNGGSYVVLVNDKLCVINGEAGKDLSASIQLTKGQHNLKIRNTSSKKINIHRLSVTMDDSPEQPTLSKVTLVGNCLNADWEASTDKNIVGYNIYYGTSSGSPESSVNVANSNTASITGLNPKLVYYVMVQAIGKNGRLSLASSELRVGNRSTDDPVIMDFEALPVDTNYNVYNPLVIDPGYQFIGFGNTATLITYSPQSKNSWDRWPSQVLFGTSWGCCHRIQREDFKPFDLYSLELCSLYANTSAVIIGYDPSGASFKKVVNFPAFSEGKNRLSVTVVLDWLCIGKFEVKWCDRPDGIGGNRTGGIDNIIINTDMTQK